MTKLSEVFRKEGIDGYHLTKLSEEDPVSVALRFKVTLPECEDMFNCIDDLGHVDNLELMLMVNEEFDTLKVEADNDKRRKVWR